MAPDALPDLPIRAVLAEVIDALGTAGTAVLVAPPGTGKTTVVPLALAAAWGHGNLTSENGGRVVVAEPRRVAARAAARRMAALLGEEVGGRVGYTVRGDRRVSARTRIEVVTTGVLVRRLHRDPELSDTAVVVLDECHERHLDSDLALAFLIEVRAALRPDLFVLATSATAEADRFAELLGRSTEAGPTAAPIVTAAAALHPVEVRWCPPSQQVAPPLGLRVDPRLLDQVAATVRRALTDSDGDVLVFLPGAREIQTVTSKLHGIGADVVALHGRQSGAAQDAALRPGTGRRVVLATAVAESSLTVPGVRAVVDAGLSRVPRMDHARGLGALVTVPVSRAAATQRAGRAGREAPGRVYRCWSEAQHDRLPPQPEPEVAAADLTSFALDLARWGHPDGSGLALPDQPPPGPLRAAMNTLSVLGATDPDGRITTRGRRLSDAGLHPRLARALLDGAPLVGARRAAEIVALLDADRTADDVVAAWRLARANRDGAWTAEVRRLTAALDRDPLGQADDQTAWPDPNQPTSHADATRRPGSSGSTHRNRSTEAARRTGDDSSSEQWSDDIAAGLIIGLAHPERVARVREAGSRAYLMAGGTAAELSGGSGLAGTTWIAIADADRTPGARTARIRSAAPLDEATARIAAGTLAGPETEIGWVDGDVVARRVERLGAIVLTERRIDDPDPALVEAALRDGLARAGLGLLTWSRAAVELRARLSFAYATLGALWPDVSDQALATTDWLDVGTARRRADLTRIDVAGALRRMVPWTVAGRLDELVPERLLVPSGSAIRVDYSDPTAPVLAVKLQETFGWLDTPRVGGVPVVLHLLSPAGRPLAVTSDLASFWRNAYPGVRAEMRGRYPRHPWPEDPTAATPTRRANPRRS
ncbi:ATP-dependent RNA helicase [Actinoplanes sp. NPDC051859]|uniref:ATP-dependent RNA helicase n=1 Tax=Actinoplanes sp. NPDC051859 TaxID=3363909 RepID=UPI0037B92C23